MARIVAIHGIGNQYEGENTLLADWLPAIKDGLARAGRRLESDADFTCAFYGDLFRPSGKSTHPPYDAKDVDDDFERELLELWWREAARVDPAVRGPDAKTKVNVPQSVQRALDALSYSPFFAGVAESALIYDLKQVRRYLRDHVIRQEAQARLARAVGSDTRVIVGHSLGSIVAYEALHRHPEWPVKVLVTIGSPLGIRNLIFNALEPAPPENPGGGDRIGVWPPQIESWVNIYDEADVVALTKKLASMFGPRVVDRSVDNGGSAHDAKRYLRTRELGDAVALGL